MRFLSRKEAETKINNHWKAARLLCSSVRAPEPVYVQTRRRNYEIEDDLLLIFDTAFVINEWCPFNGIFCKWTDYCPESELLTKIAEFRQTGVSLGIDYNYLAVLLEEAIKKRLKVGDYVYFGNGPMEFVGTVTDVSNYPEYVWVEGVETGCYADKLSTVRIYKTENIKRKTFEEFVLLVQHEPAFSHVSQV